METTALRSTESHALQFVRARIAARFGLVPSFLVRWRAASHLSSRQCSAWWSSRTSIRPSAGAVQGTPLHLRLALLPSPVLHGATLRISAWLGNARVIRTPTAFPLTRRWRCSDTVSDAERRDLLLDDSARPAARSSGGLIQGPISGRQSFSRSRSPSCAPGHNRCWRSWSVLLGAPLQLPHAVPRLHPLRAFLDRITRATGASRTTSRSCSTEQRTFAEWVAAYPDEVDSELARAQKPTYEKCRCCANNGKD